MDETKQYCVTVEIYTWAESPEAARDQVISELRDLMRQDTTLSGFMHPSLHDVAEDGDI